MDLNEALQKRLAFLIAIDQNIKTQQNNATNALKFLKTQGGYDDKRLEALRKELEDEVKRSLDDVQAKDEQLKDNHETDIAIKYGFGEKPKKETFKSAYKNYLDLQKQRNDPEHDTINTLVESLNKAREIENSLTNSDDLSSKQQHANDTLRQSLSSIKRNVQDRAITLLYRELSANSYPVIQKLIHLIGYGFSNCKEPILSLACQSKVLRNLKYKDMHDKLIKKLLGYRINIDMPDVWGLTPLMATLRYDNAALARLLLDCTPKINVKTVPHGKYRGWSTLAFAKKSTNQEIQALTGRIQELADREADAMDQDDNQTRE